MDPVALGTLSAGAWLVEKALAYGGAGSGGKGLN